MFELLSHITRGTLTVRDPDGVEHVFGEGAVAGSTIAATSLSATLIVHRWEFFSRVLSEGSLGLGESYMDGWWDVEHDRVADCLGIFFRNDLDEEIRTNILLLFKLQAQRLLTKPATAQRSRKNVLKHYDLGNDFFAQMLDPTMTYSCGILDDRFPLTDPANALEAMQRRKYDLVCRKLKLRSGQHLLDVGCGWGGMICHAAKHYGVRATGVTLSDEQHAWAEKRIFQEGLRGLVTVERKDYRDVEGTFDAFVSIGMFEHVGDEQYRTFMRKARSVLAPGGAGLLHTIGWSGLHSASGFDPWMQTYIFPGAHIPPLSRITAEMEAADLTIGHVENFKLHYAETLRKWKENVDAHRPAIRALSPRYNTRFLRMWDFYLQSCEAGFRQSRLVLYQVLFSAGKEWTLPLRFRFD